MKRVKINARLVGEGKPCFIIAEAGVNHNGEIKLAKELIDVAKEARADAVKFQAFRAEELATETIAKESYQKVLTGSEETQFEMLKRLEFSKRALAELKAYSEEKGIIFLATPYDEKSADLLDEMGVPAFKIGSGEITHIPLLRHIAKKGVPIILSTGASNLQEIREAVNEIKRTGTKDIILLHCTSNYPVKLEDVNLRAMQTLKSEFNLPVGYSDHTLGIEVPITAVALGACVIEKHFTIDKSLAGPDHKASAEPDELKQMVNSIRKTELALGSPIKKPCKSEKETLKLGRRSLVSKTEIKRGETLTEYSIAVKRPGTGIMPKHLMDFCGGKAVRDIKKDEILSWQDIEQ